MSSNSKPKSIKLDDILNNKLAYIDKLKQEAKKTIFKDALIKHKNKINIIAEIKRASPSKGKISDIIHPEQLALKYQELGASAISVLTDKTGFNGPRGRPDTQAVLTSQDEPPNR